MADHPPGPREPGETAARDQKQAELRDLLRLHALMEPYAPDGSTDIKDILPVMPATDRAEAEGILDRLDLLAAERQCSLARLRHVEQALRKLAERASRSSATDSRSPTPAPARYSKIRRSRAGCRPRSRSSAGSAS